MKLFFQFGQVITLLGAMLLAFSVQAEIILESSTKGATALQGGDSVDSQLLGNRFSLESTSTITGIGGHLSILSGSVWGAIVALPSASGLPAFSGLDIESNALVSVLFEDGAPNSEHRLEPVSLMLGPGDYALVFGGDSLFGSTGQGYMPTANQLALPGSSPFFWRSSNNTWNDDTFGTTRFIVEGVTSIPEPTTAAVLLGLLPLGTLVRSRRNTKQY